MSYSTGGALQPWGEPEFSRMATAEDVTGCLAARVDVE